MELGGRGWAACSDQDNGGAHQQQYALPSPGKKRVSSFHGHLEAGQDESPSKRARWQKTEDTGSSLGHAGAMDWDTADLENQNPYHRFLHSDEGTRKIDGSFPDRWGCAAAQWEEAQQQAARQNAEAWYEEQQQLLVQEKWLAYLRRPSPDQLQS